MNITAADKLLTLSETSQRLRLGRTTVYRLMQAGELRAVVIGGRKLVPDSEITRFLNERFPTAS